MKAAFAAAAEYTPSGLSYVYAINPSYIKDDLGLVLATSPYGAYEPKHSVWHRVPRLMQENAAPIYHFHQMRYGPLSADVIDAIDTMATRHAGPDGKGWG